MKPQTQAPPRKTGTITLIVGLFLASGLIRIADIAPAFAEELIPNQAAEDIQMASVAATPDLPALLQAIQDREAQILEREAYIDRRMQTLAMAEQRIREQLNALTIAEERLAGTLALADNATEEDVSRLTEVYQRMKPTEAAEIFETMDIQFAAGFFSRMRPESSAAIMAHLPAELAYSISVVMAGRNANAPRE